MDTILQAGIIPTQLKQLPVNILFYEQYVVNLIVTTVKSQELFTLKI